MPENTYTGKTLSPGLAKGPTFVYRDVLMQLDEFYELEDAQVEQELQRLDRSITHTTKLLNDLANRVEKEMDETISGVFRAHSAILQDDTLKNEVQDEIKKELVSAGSATRTVFRRWERRFKAMESDVSKQKADDMRDLARRLISSLAGIRTHALENFPAGSVLVANRLLPSDTIVLGHKKAAAVILEKGGAGSHAALFAREIGLPCIAGIPGITDQIEPGTPVLVDADAAKAIINPTEKQRSDFDGEVEQRKRNAKKERKCAHEPAITRDGRVISVFANVGSRDDTKAAIKNGAEGVGLYRIERAYLGKQSPPDTESLLNEMRSTLEPAAGLPVTVRLLDTGADKPLPYIDVAKERNPALGLRGVRFLCRHPDLLQTQLDALLQLSLDFDLQILVPMVTVPHDMQTIKEHLAKRASETQITSVPKIGAMIETPAAALDAAAIAKYADFLSVGTNDLTQYTFAADRENAEVDSYFDDTHAVIFRLLKILHDDAPHIPLSICGELAGRAEQTAKTLKCGITALSVAPSLIPSIKESIRQCGLET